MALPLKLPAALNSSRQAVLDNQIVCYSTAMITTNGIWQGDNPLEYSLPLFILQMTLIVVTARVLVFVLKPFRPPRVVAEILGGLILGPSILGRLGDGSPGPKLFPPRSVTVLETMANVGLLYFLFLVGVEMDLSVIKKTGKQAVVIALAGMILPFIIGSATSVLLKNVITENVHQATFLLFLGVALSVTAFPVLASILAELKLLNTDLGRMAMSSAIINDVCAWGLLALAIALAETKGFVMTCLWVILSGAAFVLVCIFAVRPCIRWMINRLPEGEAISDVHVCIIMTGVMLSGFITDAIGVHATFGAFVFGLVIPNGPFGLALIEKLEDFVSGLLLPLFFAVSGLRTDIHTLRGDSTWGFLLLIIIMAAAAKVVGTMMVAFFYNISFRDGLALGLLMNTKGLIEMVVLNVGRDQKILDEESFAVMVCTSLVVTAMITPVVAKVYRPARRFLPYKRRTVHGAKSDFEFRLVACIHTPRNVPTIINLIEASHPTKRSPIYLYALHLVEQTGRASAMLIVHNTRNTGRPAMNRTQAHSDHIVNAFEHYQEHAVGVTVQAMTAISSYATMHEDICSLAEEKRAALIIVPFHKEQAVDGAMEAINPAFRTINQNLLANAPCSVGILIDRGLGGSTKVSSSQVSHHVVVLFFGGPDDREALAYAWRMAEHPGVSLTVLRFVVGDEAVMPTDEDESSMFSVVTKREKDRQLDDDLINEFRLKNVSDESIVYMEKVVNNGAETVTELRSMDSINNLYIVGRGQGMVSPLTAGISDWSECPELGPIGDLLASSDFMATVSVLVIQQYIGASVDGIGTPDSTIDQAEHLLQNKNGRPRVH